MRKVAQIMGMPITVDIPVCDNEKVLGVVFDKFYEIDTRFSLYKKSSELTKYREKEIKRERLSTELKEIIEQCKKAEEETNGYFTANYSDKFDPTGFVKGWAIAEAGKIIEKNGYKTYCISAGGDILARSDSDKVWSIGIQDPRDKYKILNKLSISNGAVASSGNYERGEHIINPKTGKPANKFLSVSVTGPDIIKSDVFATAIFAAESKDNVSIPEGYKALIVSQA